MANVGFVGLGVMGAPMAGHLLSAGHHLTVWNRTASKTAPLAAQGADVADSLEDLGARCDFVFVCVNKTEDVLECVAGLRAGAKPGTLIVDHSTILPEAAVGIHKDLSGVGVRFVDAPITGGSMGAQSGKLTIFCGGDEADVGEVLPIIAAYAKRAERVGGPGAGQTMKLANQIAVGGALIALCESLSFAAKAGLDLHQTKDLLGGGAAGSWAFDNYGPKILNEDWSPGFSVSNQLKDFRYCLQTARDIHAAVPATQLLERLLTITEEQGNGPKTTAVLYETLMGMSEFPA
jgi:3-hydroxyisobutyrate dehydrogenase-like beta-hydroxyacid dehydrogenase